VGSLAAFALLARRKARSTLNTALWFTPWERGRNAAFTLAGLGLLYGLYAGFYKLLAYLATVQLIGPFLIWKLTAMFLITTLSMTGISSLLTSLTTLFYAFDLKFLMNAPLPRRAVFAEKSLEAAFFASWMIGLVLFPFILALARTHHFGWGFLAAFLVLLPPYLLLGACAGLFLTLMLLWGFPSSRTRDVIWVLSSLSLTLVYGAIRFVQPEKLIRPDSLKVVAEYLNYLQAPTAPYLPSWWMTKALMAASRGDWPACARWGAALFAAAGGAYGLLLWLAGPLYFAAYSGAQEGALRRRRLDIRPLRESLLLGREAGALLWRERRAFLRDVKHWSQMLLVVGLVFVYLFSIQRLPLDSAELRSLISFLNIGTAGFVLAALGLRFTYPAVSIEGRSWWVVRAAPVSIGTIMTQKLLFSLLPMTALAAVLGGASCWLLHADLFTTVLSLGALLVLNAALCAMGVGFGALFPMFTVENVHQIESSVGGFVYMAASLFYIGATVTILSWPMRVHFERRFGHALPWEPAPLLVCAVLWLLLNAAAFLVPWALGRRALEAHAA
jgi:ABC-2 type transport system permease protein